MKQAKETEAASRAEVSNQPNSNPLPPPSKLMPEPDPPAGEPKPVRWRIPTAPPRV